MIRVLSLLLCLITVGYSNFSYLVEQDEYLVQKTHQIARRYSVKTPVSLTIRPISQDEILSFYQFAYDSLPLTLSEKELVALIISRYDSNRTLFSRSNEESQFHVNLDLTGMTRTNRRDGADSIDYHLKGVINPKISGKIGDLSFYSSFQIWTETQSDTMWEISNYQPYNGNPYNLFNRDKSGNIRASDMFRGGLSYQLESTRFDFAVDNLVAGPAQKNGLLLNINDEPVAFFRMIMDFEWLNYTHIAGILRSHRYYDKFLHYHRFQIPLWDNRVSLGLNESVVYGSGLSQEESVDIHSDLLEKDVYDLERSFEPIYLIPFVPFVFAEHYGGDRDNALLSFDVSFNIPTNFRWYLEFLMDDFSNPATILGDDFGNKLGVTLGGTWFGELWEKNLNITAEYCRVEPWVYTHFKGVSHRYTHFGKPVGAKNGPNSDNLWSEITYDFLPKQMLRLVYEQNRWDRAYRGGSVGHIFVDKKLQKQYKEQNREVAVDSEIKEFLNDPETSWYGGIGWKLIPYRIFEIATDCGYHSEQGVVLNLWGRFNL